MKGNRAFKFALVEFVKELLKPTWKDGQITKEDYKTIVKKIKKNKPKGVCSFCVSLSIVFSYLFIL